MQFKIMLNATSEPEWLNLFAKPLNWLLTAVSLYLNHVVGDRECNSSYFYNACERLNHLSFYVDRKNILCCQPKMKNNLPTFQLNTSVIRSKVKTL